MSAITYSLDRENSPDSLKIKFMSCTRTPKEWKEEVYAAARSIANTAQRHIWVCFNGSMDSEIICRAFFDQGIHFSVLTTEHSSGTNLNDVTFTRQWCASRGIEQKVVNINMQRFLSEETKKYAETYVSFHPVRYFQIKQMELVQSMGGYAVIGGGERMIQADLTSPSLTRADLFMQFAPGALAPLQWCEDADASHEPFFYFSTPELCASLLRQPLIKFALDNPGLVFKNKRNILLLKWIIYQSSWPDLETRAHSESWEPLRMHVNNAVEYLKNKFGAEHTTRFSLSEFEAQLAGEV